MMKKLLLLLLILFSFSVQAQFNSNAPWMNELRADHARTSTSKTNVNKQFTFQEIVDAFNTYWETRDHLAKGSGYKPFKRWENHWKNHVKEDGTLPSAAELWNTSTQAIENGANRPDASNWLQVGITDFANRATSTANIGRLNTIIVDPNNSNTYYVGAPSGGIWKSTDAGTSWTPLTDDIPYMAVSGIAIDYNNSNIIYIATGDDDANDSPALGVWKSIDGGSTWNATGLDPSNTPSSMNDIYMSTTDSNTLWVATSNGVYRTTDGGVNWSNTNGSQGLDIDDIKVFPGNDNFIYAVTSTDFYRSTDGGVTFSNAGVGSGLPTSAGRMVLGVTPANANYVYVLVADTSGNSYDFEGLYRSTFWGGAFTAIATNASVGNLFERNQAWYDMALAISPTDVDEIYTGAINVWKTSNGGTSFSRLNNGDSVHDAAYTHVDIHQLRFFNGALFAATDGGIFKSTSSPVGASFTDLTNDMAISQFYTISVSQQTSEKIAGGLQDNGGYAYADKDWYHYHGGDGMEGMIDPNDDNLYYGSSQFGSLKVSTNSGQSGNSLQIGSPESGEWITPFAINTESEVYGGYNSLYKLCGTSWQVVSQDLGEAIDILEIDDLDPDIIYAVNNGSRPLAYSNSGSSLNKSIDRGVTFTEISTLSITSMDINHNNSDIIYITTTGSNGKVLRSNDGGLTFPDDLTGSLPNVPKISIKHQDLHSQNPLFVGTSIGVYRYDDALGDWDLFQNNLPNAPIADLAINLVDGNITAGTYGRGAWQSDIPTESTTNEIKLEAIDGLDNACGTLNNLQARVKNIGTSTVSAINVEYILNGVSNNFDWAGSLASGATTSINIPSVTPTTGLQKLKVLITSASDTYLSNNQDIKSFYPNSAGSINAVNGFENVSDELIVSDLLVDACTGGGYWERGLATGVVLNSGSNNVYGTNLAGDHAGNIKSYLVSNCYDLSSLSNPILKFDLGFELEQNWDILYVEYSTDGSNWNILGTSSDPNWYNSNRTNASSGPSDDCQNCPGAQWTGTSAALQEYSYNLSALNSETSINFRFVFHSDQFTEEEGVMLDNFVIEGTLGSEDFNDSNFAIYPNPSNNFFNIKMKNAYKIGLNLYDVTGKLVLKQQDVKTINNTHVLDLSNYSSGIYFLNIISKDDNAQVTKKLILN